MTTKRSSFSITNCTQPFRNQKGKNFVWKKEDTIALRKPAKTRNDWIHVYSLWLERKIFRRGSSWNAQSILGSGPIPGGKERRIPTSSIFHTSSGNNPDEENSHDGYTLPLQKTLQNFLETQSRCCTWDKITIPAEIVTDLTWCRFTVCELI